jgi:cobalamin biosynthesis Mg chelatase CobN
VLALLALASFPVLAQAEDSAGVQYEDAPPTITVPGKTKKAHKSEPENGSSEADGHASTAPGAGGGSGPNGPGGKGGSPSNGSSGGNPSTGGGSGPGQGSHGNGSTGAQQGSQPATASGKPAATTSSGSSSPLVPILIAIAVLAAISIGAVLYRQRRQRDEAGGSGAVSPKAS